VKVVVSDTRIGDRDGQTVGPPLAYEDIRLSPDGKRLAVAIADPRIGNDDLHIIDLARESSTQITFAKGSEFTAVWSPDGRRIVYSWDNKSVPYLHEKVLDNSSPGEPIIQPSGGVQVALEWLPDGSILYSDFSSDTNQDLWLLPGKEDRKPRKILASRFNESSARVSPGPESSPHWIAYVSDESGRPEVYVRSFPQLGKLQKISNAGGRSPHWSPNGKELFYVEGDRLMAVAVKLQPEFEADRPQWLFRWSPGIIGFEVTGEGRFLVNSGAGGYFTAPISIVSGWTALLKK